MFLKPSRQSTYGWFIKPVTNHWIHQKFGKPLIYSATKLLITDWRRDDYCLPPICTFQLPRGSKSEREEGSLHSARRGSTVSLFGRGVADHFLIICPAASNQNILLRIFTVATLRHFLGCLGGSNITCSFISMTQTIWMRKSDHLESFQKYPGGTVLVQNLGHTLHKNVKITVWLNE